MNYMQYIIHIMACFTKVDIMLLKLQYCSMKELAGIVDALSIIQALYITCSYSQIGATHPHVPSKISYCSFFWFPSYVNKINQSINIRDEWQ